MSGWKALLASLMGALALLVAMPARAATVCEALPLDEAQMTLAEGRACEIKAEAREDWGDPNAAPLCDARGASMPAPERVVPIQEGRIRRAPCAPDDASQASATRGPRERHQAAPTPVAAEDAILEAFATLGEAPFARTIEPTPIEGGELEGVRPKRKRPPR